MEEYIRAEGLSKSFDRTCAVKELDFVLHKGELAAMVGPDGAGKTTFMRLICGLLDADAGSLSVLGEDITTSTQSVQEKLGYMPQKFGLYEDLSVRENLRLYADLHGVPENIKEARFERLLAMTGLAPFVERLAGKLSGGMKQKLGIACTLVSMPDILLLDEPSAGVDPLSRREIWQIIKKLVQEDNLTVLVNTAYMDEAEMCQKVYVMNQGRFIASGTPDEIRSIAAGCCYEIEAEQAFMRRLLVDFAHCSEIVDAVPVAGRLRFSTKRNVMPKIVAEMSVAEASPRLEDAVMRLLKESETSQAASNPLTVTDEARAAKNKADIGKISRADMPVGQAASNPIDIEVRDLVKKFGDFTAVSHTSFSVHKGEIFGLLGPNGAGKTTTFRMLCGLSPATAGSIRVAGEDMRTARRQARAKIGYVAQKFSLYEMLSTRENLRFFGGAYGLYGRELDERVEAFLRRFDLVGQAEKTAGSLPGGYRQRLAMAAALLHEPEILFLDEPTSGIDPLARRSFWQEIAELAMQGTTVIITTHFMDEAEYCDRIMIQDKGRMLALGSTNDLRKEHRLPQADMNELFIHIVEAARGE